MAKILIVEDVHPVVALLTRGLTNAKHVVSSAADGNECLAKVKAERPDVIIMDLSMPGMTGFEAIRRLKADPATRAIPIIALTSAATAGDRDEAYLAGCDAYEVKPVDMPVLLTRVQELTGR